MAVVAVAAVAVVLGMRSLLTPQVTKPPVLALDENSISPGFLKAVSDSVSEENLKKMVKDEFDKHPDLGKGPKPEWVPKKEKIAKNLPKPTLPANTFEQVVPNPEGLEGVNSKFYNVTCAEKLYSPLLDTAISASGILSDMWVSRAEDVYQDDPSLSVLFANIMKQILNQYPDNTALIAGVNVDFISKPLIRDEASGQLRPITEFTPYDLEKYADLWLNPESDARLQPLVQALQAGWFNPSNPYASYGFGPEILLRRAGVLAACVTPLPSPPFPPGLCLPDPQNAPVFV